MLSHNDTTGFQYKIIEIFPDNNKTVDGIRGGRFGYAFDGRDNTYYWLAMRKARNAGNGIIYQLEKDDPNDLIRLDIITSFSGDWESDIPVDSIWTP